MYSSSLIFFKTIFNSKLLKSSGIYTLFNIINASIPLLLLPILTEKLSPSDYGIVSIYQLIFSFVVPFISLNLDAAISVSFFCETTDVIRKYLSTGLILIIISFLIIAFLFILNKNAIINYFKLPFYVFPLIFFTSIGNVFISLLLLLFQVKSLPMKYGLLQISQTILNLFLTYYLVVILDTTSKGRIIAQSATSFSFGIISFTIIVMFNKLKFQFDKIIAKKILAIGLPLIPHIIGGMIFLSIDRFFLSKLIGLEQVGNYAVSYQICTLVFLFTSSFNTAFVPWLFQKLNENHYYTNLKIVKLTYMYSIFLFIGGLVLFFSFPLITSIFVKGKYDTVNFYSFFLLLGFIFQGLYFMVTNYFTFVKKTQVQALITLSVALLKIPISYFSIILMGSAGASFSYFITFLIFFFVSWYFSNRYYPMPWFYFKSSKV